MTVIQIEFQFNRFAGHRKVTNLVVENVCKSQAVINRPTIKNTWARNLTDYESHGMDITLLIALILMKSVIIQFTSVCQRKQSRGRCHLGLHRATNGDFLSI